MAHASAHTFLIVAGVLTSTHVLWLVPSPSGGGAEWATPLPLNPSLWPHMVGNADLEDCSLPMLPLIWFAHLSAIE